MRTLALFALLIAPSVALAKHHGREKVRPEAHVSAEPSRSEPVRHAMVEQADDDERPGSKQRK